MMMEPFLRAKATSSSSCLRVAAAPVGLLGLQKNMRSVRRACSQQISASSRAYALWGMSEQYLVPLKNIDGEWEGLFTLDKSGKKSFSGRHTMYSSLPKPLLLSS
jgi:hypothetical protein